MKEQRIIDYTSLQRVSRADVHTVSPQQTGRATETHSDERSCSTEEPHRRQQVRQQMPTPPLEYQYDDGSDAVYDSRSPSSARRYQMPVTQGSRAVVRVHRQTMPPRRSRRQEDAPPVQQQQRRTTTTPKATPVRERYQWHWAAYVILTCLAILVLLGGMLLLLNWWHGYQDDLHYGRPRTAQYDVRVGHGEAHTLSHFLVVNLHRQVEIIEFPGGDATKARVYLGPMLVGDGQDLTPVTLEFRDVNGDGKPDMIVHIEDSKIVFINDNGQFRPAKPSDTINL